MRTAVQQTGNKEKNESLAIVLCAYDVLSLESAAKAITEKLLEIGADFTRPFPLCNKRHLFSIPVSPHRYKYAQEQYERVMHRRLIKIKNPRKQDIESINKIRVPSTVDMSWKMS